MAYAGGRTGEISRTIFPGSKAVPGKKVGAIHASIIFLLTKLPG